LKIGNGIPLSEPLLALLLLVLLLEAGEQGFPS
jgi:hypothetical protein